MRTLETVVYKFDELTEDAKQKAMEGMFDINVKTLKVMRKMKLVVFNLIKPRKSV